MRILKYLQFVTENKSGKKAIIITGEGFQDQELVQPKEALEADAVDVTVAGLVVGEIKAYNNDFKTTVDSNISELNPSDYDILILPGGKAPDTLRKNSSVINFVKEFSKTGKPIAAICHGPLILVSANLVEGKNMTCFRDAKEELISSGANYEDSSCVIDNQYITSRNPKDLDVFCQNILSKI